MCDIVVHPGMPHGNHIKAWKIDRRLEHCQPRVVLTQQPGRHDRNKIVLV